MPTAFTDTTLRFGLHQERRTAPTVPCKCHADADLFAPEADADDAPRSFDEAMEEAIADQWADEAAELADMIADAVKPKAVEPAVFPYWITC